MKIWYKICRKSNEKRKEKTMNKNIKNTLEASNGITLIALVITIALNCCEAAMERMLKKEIILNI